MYLNKKQIYFICFQIHNNKTLIHVPPKILSFTTCGIPMTQRNNGLGGRPDGSLKCDIDPMKILWQTDLSGLENQMWLLQNRTFSKPWSTDMQTPLYRVENVQVQELSNIQEKHNGPQTLIPNPLHSQLPAVASESNTLRATHLDKDFHWEAKGKSQVLRDFIKNYLVIVS